VKAQGSMRKRFVFAREERPGTAWAARFAAGRDEAERWYRKGRAAPPTAAECRAALCEHMPELLAHYDSACAHAGDDESAQCILSHYRPPPMIAGCSQAVFAANEGPVLIRNYDFDIVTGRFEVSAWSGREVIATARRPWGGCLDGMNADGLVASMTFGGSRTEGGGFSVILMLRYVLETCRRLDEAIAVLVRIPIAMAHNVTLLDRSGAHATLFLGPGRAPAVTAELFCTNHQEEVTWPEHAAMSRTVERRAVLAQRFAEASSLEQLVASFLAPPLYSRRSAFPTVYTAIYRPAEGRVDYLWPGKTWTQRIGQFESGEYTHDYGALEL
jgi:predicted choloylglycine hydrolase